MHGCQLSVCLLRRLNESAWHSFPTSGWTRTRDVAKVRLYFWYETIHALVSVCNWYSIPGLRTYAHTNAPSLIDKPGQTTPRCKRPTQKYSPPPNSNPRLCRFCCSPRQPGTTVNFRIRTTAVDGICLRFGANLYRQLIGIFAAPTPQLLLT